jgi:hypothetical protein
MDTLTVTFASSSGSGHYYVQLIGSPVRTLTCTCPGYTNIKCCKHLEAILDGDPLLADPTPTDGYAEALDAIRDSPASKAYERLIDGLLAIEEKVRILKNDGRVAKKMFYRMLSEGIDR